MGIREWVATRLAGEQITAAIKAARVEARDETLQQVSAKSFVGMSWSDLWMSGNDTKARPYVYPDTPDGWLWAAQYNPWAANAIEARARWVSAIPLELVQPKPDSTDTDDDDDFEEVKESHPVMELIERVNEFDDEVSFKYNGVVQLSTGGDWFTKVSLVNGKPAELFMLPFNDVQVVTVSETGGDMSMIGYPAIYRYRGAVDYSPEEIIRVYYASPRDPFRSISPTSKAIEAINRYRLADLAQEAIDKNGGQGGGIIGADFSLITGDEQRFMAEWNSKRKDPARMAEDKFLPPGMTYESGQITAMQAQREERNDRLKNEIFAAYGTPPAIAGDMSDASRLANADMQERMFAKNYGKPEAEMIARRFTDQLLYRYWPELKEKRWRIRPCFEGVTALQDDEVKAWEIKNAKATYAITVNGGGIASLNEARAAVDLEELEDERASDVLQVTDTPEAAPAEGEDMADTEDMSPEEEDAMIEAESEVTDPEDDALDAEVSDILGGAVKSDTPGQMGPRGGAAAGGNFDESKVKRAGGKFAPKAGGAADAATGDKPKKGRKKDPKKAARKAKAAAKRVEKAKERIAKLDADEAKLKAALQDMQGKDDPSNLRKRIGKALERLGKRREKMQGIIDRKGEKDNTPAPSEADKLAAEVAGKATPTVTLMPVVDFVGMTATDTDGLVLGVVDSIKRQGQYDGITATPSQPVVVVAGKAYRGDAVRVVMEG